MTATASLLAKAALPLGLISAAVLTTMWWKGSDAPGLVEGRSYEFWLREAEVGLLGPGTRAWDDDLSGPDLVGIASWQDQRILETTVAADALIARWEPVAVKPFSILIQGEANTASLRRVGRFRMTRDGALDIGIFDDDPVDREFAGAFHVPLASLRPGANEIRGEGILSRLVVVVADPDKPSVEEAEQVVQGVLPLETPPASMLSTTRRMLNSIEAGMKHLSREMDQALDQAGKELGASPENLGKESNETPEE